MNVERTMLSLRWLACLLGVLVAGCDKPPPQQAVGTLEWDRVELVAESAEPIIEIAASEGDQLQQGDLILRLDASRLQAQLDEAKAARAEAAARLAAAERGPRSEQIADGRAALKGAQESLSIREREVKRQRELAAQKLASGDALDTALAAWESARTQRDRAEVKLQELENGSTKEDLEQARQALARSDAAMRSIEVSFDRLWIRAPVDGRLDSLPYKLGERPPVGNVVAVMLSGAAPYARVYVPEAERVGLAPGSPAEVFVDGLAQSFKGRISKLASDPAFTPYFALTEQDRGRLTYLAEVVLEGDVGELPAGVPVQVRFQTPDQTGHE
jgi:HlyD family secretion protein